MSQIENIEGIADPTAYDRLRNRKTKMSWLKRFEAAARERQRNIRIQQFTSRGRRQEPSLPTFKCLDGT